MFRKSIVFCGRKSKSLQISLKRCWNMQCKPGDVANLSKTNQSSFTAKSLQKKFANSIKSDLPMQF